MPDIGLRDALHTFVEEHAVYTRYQWVRIYNKDGIGEAGHRYPEI